MSRHASRPCPICAKPAQQRFAPFCSARCADIDLHRWLSEQYAVAGGPPSEDEDNEPPRR